MIVRLYVTQGEEWNGVPMPGDFRIEPVGSYGTEDLIAAMLMSGITPIDLWDGAKALLRLASGEVGSDVATHVEGGSGEQRFDVGVDEDPYDDD